MGNRGGVLHNEQREIIRSWKTRRWITCLLEFKGRRRSVMSPGRYTELFFLDEAVSFASGHRPCAECRRERFNAFREVWRHALNRREPLTADEIDAALHRARMDRLGAKLTYEARLESLPDGCFIEMQESSYLVWDDALLLWSPQGYLRRIHRPESVMVTVLTPAPAVECFRQGYKPAVHESVLGR